MVASVSGPTHLAIAIAATVLCGDLAAQTLHPNLAVFRPSVDHAAAASDGRPLVDHYELHISRIGAARPALIVDLGKPAPDPDGFIRVNVEGNAVNVPALFGMTLEARVTAVGSQGVAASGPSNLFAVDGCRSVAPGAVVLPAGGGALDIPVVVTASCGAREWSRDGATVARETPVAGVVHIDAPPNTRHVPVLWRHGVGTQLIFVLQPAAR